MRTSDIPVFVISLENSERRNIISNKLKDFDYEFIDAVYGKNFLSYIEILNNDLELRARYKRGITPGEYGCSMSHRMIYSRMIEEKLEWAIILEDDVDFDFNFQKQIIDLVKKIDKKSLYILGCQEGLPSFDHVVLSKEKYIEYKDIIFRKVLKSDRYIYRTAAYLISLETAENILKFTENNFCLADDWFIYSKNKLFNHIYLGGFVRHPEILEGQSTIESERLYDENYKFIRKVKIFDLLRYIKKIYRPLYIKFFFDR